MSTHLSDGGKREMEQNIRGVIDEPVPSFEAWKKGKESEKREALERRMNLQRAGARGTTLAPGSTRGCVIYDPNVEQAPDHMWHSLQVDAIDEKLEAICTQLLHALQADGLNDDEVTDFLGALADGKKVSLTKAIVIALTGEQGVGKSSLINALLNRFGLAESSNARRACTHYATRYEYKPGASDSTTRSDISIEFLGGRFLTMLIEEHIRYYIRYHFSSNQESSESDGSSNVEDLDAQLTMEDKNRATTAMEFFKVIWGAKDDPQAAMRLSNILTAENLKNGTMLRECLSKVDECKKRVGAGENDTIHFRDVEDKDLPQYRNRASSLWPIVKVFVVATGSRLLRSGVSLLDLPGLGDLNQSRTAIANDMRRTADFEIVLAPPARISTRADVHLYIVQAIKAHGIGGVIVLVNKIDHVIQDGGTELEFRLEECLNEKVEHPWPQLREAAKLAEETMIGLDVMSPEINEWMDYQNHIYELGRYALAYEEARGIATDLKGEHGQQLNVFAVSANEYLLGMNLDGRIRPKFGIPRSGIPLFRQHLLVLSSEDKYRNHRNHVFRTLPDLVHQMNRICDKQMDDVSFGRFRSSFQVRIQEFIGDLRSRWIYLNELGLVIPSMDLSSRSEEIAKVVKSFAYGVQCNTYNKALRENGIPVGSRASAYKDKDPNWNNDLLQPLEDDMNAWMRQVNTSAKQLIAEGLVGNNIQNLESETQSLIHKCSSNADLRRRVFSEWKTVENNLKELLKRFPAALEQAIMTAYRGATTEEDVDGMIAVLNASNYQEVEAAHTGRGKYKRQQNDLLKRHKKSDSNGQTFLDRYKQEAEQSMQNGIESAFNHCLNQISERLDSFTTVTQQLVANEAYFSAEHKALRARIKDALPAFETGISELKSFFPDSDHSSEQDGAKDGRQIKKIKIEGNLEWETDVNDDDDDFWSSLGLEQAPPGSWDLV